MRRLTLGLSCLGLYAICGCGEAPPSAPKSGLEFHAPGVDIKLNPQDGLEVKAPGTEVRAGQGKGVEVKAPGTEVRANQDGVQVKAPGVDVDVDRKKTE